MRSLAVSALAVFAALTVGCSPDDHRGNGHGYAEPPPACSAATSCGKCTPLSGCGWCQYEDGTGSCTTSPTRCKTHTFRWNWDPEMCPASDGGVDTGDAEASTDAPSTDAPGTDAPSTDTGGGGTDAPSTDTGTDAPSTDALAEAGDADEVSTDATEDGATDGAPIDSPPATDSAPASDTSVATDTGPKCGVDPVPSGCAVSTGGTLCKGTQYTLGCLGAAVPTPSAACAKAYAKGGETYYCCPCR
ncbi:MAG: hypothetical protein JNL79_18225 [Myxococcales bacterium]|nr:hypothetical protein [Myxococcales bacterium]